jgi:cytochrome c peroxidase
MADNFGLGRCQASCTLWWNLAKGHYDMRNRAIGISLGCLLLALAGCRAEDYRPLFGGAPQALAIEVPWNLPPMTIPADNPTTYEGVDLGRRLFYDVRLSGDNTMSCGSCHGQAYAFTDHGKVFSEGIDGRLGDIQAMPLANLAWSRLLFWDGRNEGLESQALEPVRNPVEMHETWPNALAKLQADPDYPKHFKATFGTAQITEYLVARAIAQFERTMVSANSDYDKYVRKETNNLSESAKRGAELFFGERADCFHCHSEGLLTDFDFHNNGLDAVLDSSNLGRAKVTGLARDHGKFKTPGLHNVALTAPYMHDGRFATLEEVVEHYNSGIVQSPTLDPKIKSPDGLYLSNQEKADLVAFLKALSDQSFIENPAFSDPY